MAHKPPEESATTPANLPSTESTEARPGPSVVDAGASTAGLDAHAVVPAAAIVESPVVAIFINDLNCTIRTWSPGAERLYGYSPGEAVGRSVQILVPDDRAEEWSHVMSQVAGGDHVEYLETERIRRDGRRVAVALTISPMRDGGGKLVSACVIGRDITDRKGAVAALRESEEKLRQFIEHAPLAIAMFDRQMRYLAVSRRWLADYCLGDGEITGRSHYELFPEIPARWREVHQRGLKGEVVRADDDFFRRVDGTAYWLRWEVRPWKQANGTIGGIVIFAEDMSARKRTEEALVQSEERFRLMADHAPVMIWMSGTDRHCTWFNKPWLAFVGRPMAQELGDGWSENVHPGDFDRCLQAYAAAFDARQQFTMEYRLKRRDGEHRWILDTGIPVHGASGEFTGYIGSCVDITDRKRAEEALLHSEARMQAILNTATDAIITMDIQGVIQSVNPACERMFGYAAAEMVGHNVRVIMPSPYWEEHDGYLSRYLQTGERHIVGAGRELFARRKDGTIFPMHLAVSEIEDRQLFTGILRDMTEYKQMERELVDVASRAQQSIGEDLHDSVGQELTALNLMAGKLAESIETNPANASKLVERMTQGLKRSQKELRAVLRGLLPVAVDSAGLMAALIELANRTHQERQVTCTFDCPEPVTVADNLTATYLFLIAQEAVHNALKHGKPRNIRISLHAYHQLVLQVACDGIGMPARPEATKGLGLRIMRNRAALIGAHLTIEPFEPTGTVVTCRLVREFHEPGRKKAARPRRRRPRGNM